MGSCNLDLVVEVTTLPHPGETVFGSTFRRTGGGKGANQAVAAARDGASVIFLGAVGDDDAGRYALADLDSEGVDTSTVVRSAERPTGTAFIMVDARGENTIVVVSGANACLDAGVEGLLEGFAVGTDDVVLTGFEVPLAAVEASAQLARRRGARMVINPAPALPLSDRPGRMCPDPDAECRGGDAPDRRARCPDRGAPPLGPDRDLGGRDAWSRWGAGRAWR